MTTVFLSGSRKLSRLNDAIRARIENMISRRLHLVLGDANGADKAMQRFLAEAHYPDVTVFCSGTACRNNIGDWPSRNVSVDPRLKGREFYAEKDKAMASQADFGFVLWDGSSTGSVNNILSLLNGGKCVVVYFAPEKRFFNLKTHDDLRGLFAHCSATDYSAINRKLHLDRQLASAGASLD